MTLAQLVPLAINLSIFLLVLALGLDAELKDALSLFRQPSLLLRSILAMNGVMAVIAAGVALAFDMPPPVRIALLALAISPVPPILPGKQQKAGGSKAYAIGLLVAASILSVGLSPLLASLVGRMFGEELDVPPQRIAVVVLVSVVVPLAIGIAVRRMAPGLATTVRHPISTAATVLLVVACLPALFTAWPAIWALVGNGVAIALVAFTLIGLLVGHVLGGPDPGDRSVLALATGTRHPGVAIALASTTFPDVKSALAVVIYHLVIGTLVSIPYVRWRRGIAERGEPPPGQGHRHGT